MDVVWTENTDYIFRYTTIVKLQSEFTDLVRIFWTYRRACWFITPIDPESSLNSGYPFDIFRDSKEGKNYPIIINSIFQFRPHKCNGLDLHTVIWHDQKKLCHFLNNLLQFKQNNCISTRVDKLSIAALPVRTNWSITLWSRNLSNVLISNIIVILHLSVCRLPLPAQTDQLPFDFERWGLSHFRCDCLLLHLSDDVVNLEFHLDRYLDLLSLFNHKSCGYLDLNENLGKIWLNVPHLIQSIFQKGHYLNWQISLHSHHCSRIHLPGGALYKKSLLNIDLVLVSITYTQSWLAYSRWVKRFTQVRVTGTVHGHGGFISDPQMTLALIFVKVWLLNF